MALAAGTRLGPYEITGSLGAGGMGEVYRATHLRSLRRPERAVGHVESRGGSRLEARGAAAEVTVAGAHRACVPAAWVVV